MKTKRTKRIDEMKLRDLYYRARDARIIRYACDIDVKRAQRIYRRLLRNPGDCEGDTGLLMGLAIAESQVGRGPGWIPEVQRIGCLIAEIYER